MKTFKVFKFFTGLLAFVTVLQAQLADPMVPGNWKKYPEAVFSASATNQLWGPGHACFTTSPDGKQDWIVYHAKISSANYTDRLACVQQFSWKNDSLPDFGIPKGKTSALTIPSGETVAAATFSNPIKSTPSPDPMVYKHTDGYYYGLHTMFINGAYVPRFDLYRSKNLTDVYKGAGKTIWNAPTTGWNTTNLWAPELHFINNAWYIYYAGGGKTGVLTCTKADPYATTSGDWTSTQLISNINDWAIDGTVLEASGSLYFIWSGIDGQPAGTQKLFISKMSSPTKLTGNRAIISIPQNAWETKGVDNINNVNEGPFILKHNGKVMCVYSASFCETQFYCLGLLQLAGRDMTTTTTTETIANTRANLATVKVTCVNQQRTVIQYSLPLHVNTQDMTFDVYSVNGKFVQRISLKVNMNHDAIVWNNIDSHGALVKSGLYVVRMRAGTANVITQFSLMQ